jgi:aminoglycoside phosphotransferase (APT) family kinase protein
MTVDAPIDPMIDPVAAELRALVDTAAIPSLAVALDPEAMGRRLGIDVDDVTLLSLKPGRRAVVRYATADGGLVAKVRVGHRPTTPFRLMQRFRAAGFDRGPVRVAEPVAVMDDLDMWVQRVAPGVPGNELLDRPAGPVSAATVSRLAAAALHRIHTSGVPPKRVHTIDDELAVLDRRLEQTAVVRPDLADRLRRLSAACRRRAGDADDLDRRGGPTGIHRDAYADQFLIDHTGHDGNPLTTVIDFDLHCLGDPALDIGNFVAHLTEHAIRTRGDAAALAEAEYECRDDFLALAGAQHAVAVDVYTDLTLARHVALSTTVPGRSHLTDAVLARCEARLA